jgi:hypothetical protein
VYRGAVFKDSSSTDEPDSSNDPFDYASSWIRRMSQQVSDACTKPQLAMATSGKVRIPALDLAAPPIPSNSERQGVGP